MRKLAVVLAVLTLGACGGGDEAAEPDETTAPPTTAAPTTTVAPTTTLSPEEIAAAELAADADLIVDMWRGISDAYGNGANTRAGLERQHASAYPGTVRPLEECIDSIFPAGIPDGYAEEVIVDRDTIERDDDWVLPQGTTPNALTGTVPPGRIYIYSATTTTFEAGFPPAASTSEIHAAILDGVAYLFLDC